jgi:nucleotide-binding universal stress UspA family protein
MTFASGDIVNQWIATLNQDAREVEDQAIAKHGDSGVNIESMVVEGYPSAAIIDVAEKKSADLIVMGSHGRSGLKRLWIGSVAESVVREAPVPVLIVR